MWCRSRRRVLLYVRSLSGTDESNTVLSHQKVLQFQSRGTLAAISGPFGRLFAPGTALTGVVGVVCGMSVEEAELDAWLLLRLCHSLNMSKQWPQVREGLARGLKLASWSSGTAQFECQSQKMLPHLRQWWRRTK